MFSPLKIHWYENVLILTDLTQIQKIILPSSFTAAAAVMYYAMYVSCLLALYQQNGKSELKDSGSLYLAIQGRVKFS